MCIRDRDDSLFTGVLLVSLDLFPADVGVGDLQLELVAPDGSIASDSATQQNAGLRVEQEVGVLNLGEYTVRIKDAGNITTAGVRYTLTMDLVAQETLAACAMPSGLAAGVPYAGDSEQGASYTLGSTCTSEDNFSAEQIYTFDVTAESYFTATLETTNASADHSLSLRSVCESINLSLIHI